MDTLRKPQRRRHQPRHACQTDTYYTLHYPRVLQIFPQGNPNRPWTPNLMHNDLSRKRVRGHARTLRPVCMHVLANVQRFLHPL